jgi:hypothetical protein
MCKMGLHDSFGHLKHKLWPKERSKVKLAIWLPTIKSRESTWLPCVHVACHIPWKVLDKGYNFALDLISIEDLHTKLWGPKVAKVPRQNAIWMWASWRGIKYIIRGKVVASPKSGPWWVLWVWICLWLVLAPKVLQLCINQLVVLFV